MSPPFPPSPPLGPPRGTYFSRRNARHPLPPSPAFTVMVTSSTNIRMRFGKEKLKLRNSESDARFHFCIGIDSAGYKNAESNVSLSAQKSDDGPCHGKL